MLEECYRAPGTSFFALQALVAWLLCHHLHTLKSSCSYTSPHHLHISTPNHHHHLFLKRPSFHAQLGLDVPPEMKPLHISLNTAHSGCKPSTFISSFTHSYQVFLPLPTHLTPVTTTFLHSDTQSSLLLRSICPNHLNLPCLTTSSTLCTPRRLQIHTAFPILQWHSAHPSHHHPFCSLQTLQICFLIFTLKFQMPKPFQSVPSHHLSHTLNTRKTVQDLTSFPIYITRKTVWLKTYDCLFHYLKHLVCILLLLLSD